MKYIISSIIVTCLISSAFSQIPNPGFENWTNGTCVLNSFKTPDNWGTINSLTCLLGDFVVEQTTDKHSGSYAIKLITKNIAGNQAPALAVTGTINTSLKITEGGFIYSSRPEKLTGWYKYTPVNNDTLSISCVLWRRVGGVYELIAEAEFESPSAVSSYTRFDAFFTYSSSATPDSAKIELISSNREATSQVNSTLWVDDLAFANCSSLSVSLSTTPVSTVTGADGSATATPSGGTAPYGYYWTPSQQATQTIINLGAGTYCVTVSDANGCTATTTCQDVTGPDCSTLAVSVSTHDATTTGGNDGSAAATATGGNPPYTYAWDSGETTDSISTLTKAVYCVTVTDASGCTVAACGTVNDPGCTTLSLVVTGTDATTVGGNDGSATAAVTGGTPGYAFLWNTIPPETSGTIINLSAGNYCVTVTDMNNCNATDCVDVNEPDCSGFSVNVTTTPQFDYPSGTASANVAGGQPPISYLWNTGDTTQNLSNLWAGSYCVTVTDDNGCAASACDSVEIELGMNDLLKMGIKLFPNPAGDVVTIELENAAAAYHLRLFDVIGKTLVDRVLTNKSTVIPLDAILPGHYLYELKNKGDGNMLTGKLVVE